MTCSHPGTVAPEELLAYADGDALPRVAEHLRQCPGCAALAASYRLTEAALRRKLLRFDCPSPHAIGEYELGLLPPADRTAVAAHMVDCPRCAEELRTLRGFLATPMVPTRSMVDTLVRIVASLVSPGSRELPALAGALRTSQAAGSAVYRAGELTVRISPGPMPRQAGTGSLVGMVLPERGEVTAGGRATLLPEPPAAPNETQRTVEIDDLGSFAFDAVPHGAYTLELRLADGVVVIEGLRVGG